MRKTLLFVILMYISINILQAQDEIKLKDGRFIECSITDVKDSVLFIGLKNKGQRIKTTLNWKKIEWVKYGGDVFNSYGQPPFDLEGLQKEIGKEDELYELDLAEIEEKHPIFIVTKNNKLITEGLEYKERPFWSSEVSVNGHKFPQRNIKFIKANNGFFAQVEALSITPKFYKRVQKSKLNLFERYNYSYSYNGGFVRWNETRRLYYNKGFHELKKANYQNLKTDLADNPKSMVHLQKYRRDSNIEIFSFAGAGVALLVGVLQASKANDESKNPGETPSYAPIVVPICISGAGMWIGHIIGKSKKKHIDRAIAAYNFQRP